MHEYPDSRHQPYHDDRPPPAKKHSSTAIMFAGAAAVQLLQPGRTGARTRLLLSPFACASSPHCFSLLLGLRFFASLLLPQMMFFVKFFFLRAINSIFQLNSSHRGIWDMKQTSQGIVFVAAEKNAYTSIVQKLTSLIELAVSTMPRFELIQQVFAYPVLPRCLFSVCHSTLG